MNIDEVRIKERDALSIQELDYLAEHKDELSAQELTKFKLEAETEEHKDELSTEDKDLLAAIKSGDKKVIGKDEVTVEKSTLDGLVAATNEYKEEKVKDLLDSHVKRGAIKSDQVDFWSKQLLSADGDSRTGMEAALKALPSNEQLASEIGSDDGVIAGTTPREQLHTLANEKIAAAAKEGKELLYTDALKQVNRENPDLMKQDLAQQGVK